MLDFKNLCFLRFPQWHSNFLKGRIPGEISNIKLSNSNKHVENTTKVNYYLYNSNKKIRLCERILRIKALPIELPNSLSIKS